VDLNYAVTIVFGAIVGSLATGTFAWYRQHHGQKQQFRLDIIKNRLEVFGKLSTDYILMASALFEFHELAPTGRENDELRFYFICKFFSYYSKIAEEAGGFEFENRQSEDVVTYLVADIMKIFSDSGFGYERFSDMIDLVTSEDGKIMRFNKFKVKNQEDLFSEFQNKIIKENRIRDELMRYSNWLQKIIIFEINMGFRYWYNESPEFDLEEPLIKYLVSRKLEKYLDHLSYKSKIKKFFSVKRNYY